MRLVSLALAMACAAGMHAQTNYNVHFDTSAMNQYDANQPLGWASTVTGSTSGDTLLVSSASELKEALDSKVDQTIIIPSGEMEITRMMNVKSNKTIIGMPGAILYNPNRTKSGAGIFKIEGSNVIVRNITFKGAGAYDVDGNDNISIEEVKNVWIDHCDIQDGVDDNLDITNGADNVCVSWTRFRYLIAPLAGGSGGSNDHRNCNLIGGSDKNASQDAGKLRVTFANCWWDEGCHERMPRVRFGKVHVANSLFSSSITNYCIGAGYRANIYAEANSFTTSKTQKKPWAVYATSGSYTDYNITMINNLGASDVQQQSGNIEYFIPSTDADYTPFSVYDAAEVESNVKSAAGATLQLATSGVAQVSTEANTTNTQYFNLSGTQLSSPAKGVNIVKKTYSDGSIKTSKIIVK